MTAKVAIQAGGDSCGQQSYHRLISKVAIQAGGDSGGQQSCHRLIPKAGMEKSACYGQLEKGVCVKAFSREN